MPSRVVITGMGWVTPLGIGIENVWNRLLAGDRAVGPVRRFDASTCPTTVAAEVESDGIDESIEAVLRERNVAARNPNTRFAISAAMRAWRQAGLDAWSDLDPRRIGMYMGCGEGVMNFDNIARTNLVAWDDESRQVDSAVWAREAFKRFDLGFELEQEPHSVLWSLASVFPIGGPSANCMTACAASTQSVGEGLEWIKRGDADVMLAGGSHSMIHPLGMSGFMRLTAMSKRTADEGTPRPFSRTRDGFVMGEGAGMVVLESLDHALARGATPLVEIVGYGSSADSYRITDIEPGGRGAQQAMLAALRQAGIDPRETDDKGRAPVQYISAHGTGTQENDAIETAAIKGVFGPMAPRVPVSSVKGMMGHLIQAAGAVELMTCVQAIRTGWLPPTVNLSDPDPVCDLDYVPNEARDTRDSGGVDVAMSNGFGFGGQNDCVCIRRYIA